MIFCPYSAGLQQLLRVCSQHGLEFNINYKAKNILITRSRDDQDSVFPDFSLPGTVLQVFTVVKY